MSANILDMKYCLYFKYEFKANGTKVKTSSLQFEQPFK